MLSGCQGHSVKIKHDIGCLRQVGLFGDLLVSITEQDETKYNLVIQRLLVNTNKAVTLETLQTIPLDFIVHQCDILFCHPGKCIAIMLTSVGWKEIAFFLLKPTNGHSNRSSSLHTSNGHGQSEVEFRISTQFDGEQTSSQPILCHWSGNGAEYIIAFRDGRVLLRSHLQHRNLVNFYPYGRFDSHVARVGRQGGSTENSPIITAVDVSPDGSRIATLCPALGRATIFRSSDQSQLMELIPTSLQISKGKQSKKNSSGNEMCSTTEYATILGRFSRVEGAALSYRFMAIHAPKGDSEPVATGPSYLAAWDASRAPYVARRIIRLPDVTNYSAIAVSQEGRYVGVGDGDSRIHVYIAFSLQRLYSLRRPMESHLAPISDIHFLPSRTTDLRENDVELLSFATLHSQSNAEATALIWHAVPQRPTVSILVVGAGFLLIVFLFFYTISYFGM